MAEKGDGLKAKGVQDGKRRYVARIIATDPSTGKKIVDTERVILAVNKAEAHAERDRLTKELLSAKLGQAVGGKRMRFFEASTLWIETVKRYGTQVSWRSHVRQLNKAFGDHWLDKMSADDMQRYLLRLPLSRSTVNGRKTVLINIFDWAKAEGHYHGASNPVHAVSLKKKRSSEDVLMKLAETETPAKKALTHDELSRFLPRLRSMYPHLHALVLTCVGLGTRFSEVSALKRSDVNWQTGELIIRRSQVHGRIGPPKGDKARAAALPPSVLATVRAHVAEMDRLQWPGYEEWLFPARPTGHKRKFLPLWDRSVVGVAIKAVMERVGASTVNTTHFARHSLAGLMKGHEADAVMRSVLGQTEQIHAGYGDARVVDFARAVDRVVLGPSGNSSVTSGKRGENKR